MIKLAKNLTLPIDFVTERIAFLARTGAGKSGGMRVLFEQFVDAGQFCIFADPKGDAYGIRGDGKGPGKSVLVIGGDHGDIPLEATAGNVIAEFLVKERVSTVLDISDLSNAKMWRFMADFTRTLYKHNRQILHLFIDEVDMIAGQTYFDPDCLHGIQLIQNKGRARGFGLTIATQRPQIVNKTILNASGTLIAMQTLGDDALKVVKSWLSQTGTKEAAQKILAVLPTLKTREAFVYSPQLLGIEPVQITFDEFQTFDSMRTPRPGEAQQKPKKLAEIDLGAIQRDMAATIEAVKANDPETLKAEVARLKNELTQAQKAIPEAVSSVASRVETVTKEIEVPVPVLDQEALERFEKAFNAFHLDWRSMLERFTAAIAPFADAAEVPATGPLYDIMAELRQAKPTLPAHNTPVANVQLALSRVLPTPVSSRSAGGSVNASSHGSRAKIGKSEMNVLKALFWMKDDRSDDMRKIAFLAGYSPSASTVSVALSNLRKAGLIEGRQLTQAGFDAIPADIEPKPTGADLRDWIRGRVGKTENAILDVLLAYPDNAFSIPQLAEHTGYSPTASTLSVALSKLRKFEAVEGGGREGVRIAKVFFE